MAPEQDERPHSPDLLEDESLNDIGVPPELPPSWAPAPLGTEGTPLRALIPGMSARPSLPSHDAGAQRREKLGRLIAAGRCMRGYLGWLKHTACVACGETVTVMNISVLCRRPAAGQDASAVHPQDAHACDAHAGADSWKPLAVTPDGHVSSGVPQTAHAWSHV